MRPNSQKPREFDPRDLFKQENKLPQGTTDNVMARLFPERRANVDTSEERRHEVWDILVLNGIIIPMEEAVV